MKRTFTFSGCLTKWRQASLPAVKGGILPPGKIVRLAKRSTLPIAFLVATRFRRAGSPGATSAKVADATIFRPALSLIWLLAGTLAHAAAPAVTVNGIAVFWGVKSAALQWESAAPMECRSFLLTEGETRFGIRLLAVDAATASVQIDNGGQIQTLHLHSAANVAPAPAVERPEDAAWANTSGDKSFDDNADATEAALSPMIPGNPGWGTLPPIDPVARQAARQAQAAAAAAGNGAAAVAIATNPGTGGINPASEEWYQESANIERDRLATAAAVVAGDLTPLPRTPLTPAATPASLVDSVNGIYASHMADFMTHDWSQM